MPSLVAERAAIQIALLSLLMCAAILAAAQNDSTSIAIEALSRLKNIDLEANPAVKTAVMHVIESTKGTPQFVELVRDFKIKDQDPALLAFALTHPSESAGVEAMRLLLAHRNLDLVNQGINGPNAASAIEVLGNTGEKQIVSILEPVIADSKRDVVARQQAVHALAQVQDGAALLLKLAKEDKLASDLKLTTSSELNNVRWSNIKTEAMQVLPPVQGQNLEPLPPIAELVKRKGDFAHGEQVFFSPQVNCGSCHQVNGKGVDFGPKLSEIGTKLGKDGLYAAILDPNAGISFGYETWQIELKNGDEAYGLLSSETEDEIAIKAAGNIVSRYKKSDMVRREKLKSSIMPTGLQQAMNTQDLVDLVEYLSSLKKSAGGSP